MWGSEHCPLKFIQGSQSPSLLCYRLAAAGSCVFSSFTPVGKDNAANKATNQDASKHLGGREGKQQTMKTNTKQGAAFSTWARYAVHAVRL